jgi:microcystin-dependent protein
MTNCSRKSVSSLVLAGSLAVALAWSSDSYACSSDPYLGSVCIMAWPKNVGFGGGAYAFANGATLPISNYMALFSILGTTYGGNGQTTFQLPDLQGRVVVGSGTGLGLPTYIVGTKSGTPAIALTTNQLPPHTHILTTGAGGVSVTVGAGNLAAQTTLTGLNATTTMAGVTASVNGSALTLNGNNGSATTGSAGSASLATPAGPANKIYSSGAPNVAMAANSISGTAAVAFTGNPTTTVTGNPTTTLTGTQTVSIGGSTGATGSGQPFSIMPPYLVMTYYIAIQGLYPSQD